MKIRKGRIVMSTKTVEAACLRLRVPPRRGVAAFFAIVPPRVLGVGIMRQCLPSPSRTSNGVRHEPDVTVRRHALHLLIFASWLATPIVAHGQSPAQTRRIPRVGILSTLAYDPEALASRLSTSLRPLGWGYPENVSVDVRSAAGDLSRLPRLAAQLVQLKPDVLLAL